MKIFVDYDSTLNDMSYSWMPWLNEEYGVSVSLKDVTHWEWFTELGVDAFKWFKDGIAFDLIKPLAKSQEFWEHLTENYDAKILTASHENMLVAKNTHILKYYGDADVIHHHAKWDYAEKGHVLIDDRILNCVKWVEAGGIAFLFNHEGNYNYTITDFEHVNLYKVGSYEEIKEKLKELE